jgi:hypothetical protein
MKIRNAIITSAIIDMGDRDLLTSWLQLDYGGEGQGFGGYALYFPKSYAQHKLLSHAGHFIFRCMEIAGVDSWHKMVGKTIRVKCDDGKVYAIGHIVKNDWFDPSADFAISKTD